MSKIEVNEIDAQSGTTITVGSACKSVAVPGNVVKTNAVQASDAGNIISQSGTTITIGASGDTVSLASGASQSGFGRAGSVDWQTGSIKTSATFTAASGEGYFVDTSSNAITANLPAGSAGAIVSFSDYARNFATNALTITPNGSEKIGGVAASVKLIVNGQALTLVYVDGTKGWVNVQNAEDTEQGASFITATGGTITTVNCGACKVHTFTGPGTFCVSAISNLAANNQVSYLVVAGGGGGASRNPGNGSGGGGAGGFREDKSPVTPYTASPLDGAGDITVTATSFPIAVGGGGAAGSPVGPSGVDGVTGAVSTFSTITSAGGGGGGNGDTLQPGDPGGSGGGGGGGGVGTPARSAAGAGNTPPTTPPQGNPGGTGAHPSPSGDSNAAGGGGATAAGSANPPSDGKGGAGGAGATTSITASPVGYAGGGEGAGGCNPGGNPAAPFGGGNGGYPSGDASAGATNKGGGGGGGRYSGGPSGGGAGGSGVVIIRYKIG